MLDEALTAHSIYVAMWSGPRNISTAMMRSWENRPDTMVVDEPLYAYYLKATGYDHPGREQIIAHYETDWTHVVSQLTAPLSAGYRIYYQKHMTHHVLPEMSLEWLQQLTNCFLIRDPREVITSYIRVYPDISLERIGLEQQKRLFDHVRRYIDSAPPVLDARDVLQDPAGILRTLCDRIGIPFSETMLSWPAGSRDSDGIWNEYWYAAVEQSTGFAPYQPKDTVVPDHLQALLTSSQAIYEEMLPYKLAIGE